MSNEEYQVNHRDYTPPAEERTSANMGGKTNKVVVRQIPADVNWEEFDSIFSDAGDVQSIEHTGSKENPTAIIAMKSPEIAQKIVQDLANYDYHGCKLKITYFVERSRVPNTFRRRVGGPMDGSQRAAVADLPLRMAVDARLVGAIIGQGGANIREITKDSKARCVVDVNRAIRDSSGAMEKVISIYGQPENCSKACVRILETVRRESAKDPQFLQQQGKSEPELKVRVHNNLVGRLIGKQGATIKKIMEDTQCTIFVSNHQQLPAAASLGPPHMRAGSSPFLHSISELSAFNLERTITIRGPSLEAIGQAEQRISTKLRQCWENDMINTPNALYGGAHPLMPAGAGIPHTSALMQMPPPLPNTAFDSYMAPPVGGLSPYPGAYQARQHSPYSQEQVHMWVPNTMVGALIGTKGVHIRNVMRMTGAHIRIDVQSPAKPADGEQQGDPGAGGDYAVAQRGAEHSERMVTITGDQHQQYKAQFWIYQRVSEQQYHFFDEVRLCTEVRVPSKLVGRIIGKSGQNVRELQRTTGAQVKIPEDATNDEQEFTTVRIIGNFNASQAVQNRIRQLVTQFHMQQGRAEQQRSASAPRD